MSFNREVKTAIEAALESGKILRKFASKTKSVRYKGTINLVTEADKLSQEKIIRILKKGFPEYSILSEEDLYLKSNSPIKWIIDPLDGTTNFAHNLPIYSISIALEVDGKIEMGVV
ncbi:MAG: inositol monophosphatase family protein, partial [candidate division WOR-3 bacterium]